MQQLHHAAEALDAAQALSARQKRKRGTEQVGGDDTEQEIER